MVREGKPRQHQLVTEASHRRKLGEADRSEREGGRALTHCDEWSSRCGGRLLACACSGSSSCWRASKLSLSGSVGQG